MCIIFDISKLYSHSAWTHVTTHCNDILWGGMSLGADGEAFSNVDVSLPAPAWMIPLVPDESTQPCLRYHIETIEGSWNGKKNLCGTWGSCGFHIEWHQRRIIVNCEGDQWHKVCNVESWFVVPWYWWNSSTILFICLFLYLNSVFQPKLPHHWQQTWFDVQSFKFQR